MIILEQYVVPGDLPKTRLIDYAQKIIKGIPTRSAIKKAIKRGEIIVDGGPCNQSDWLIAGQTIEFIFIEKKQPKVFEFPLEIVFQDEHLAVINKPAGISVGGNKYKTIVNALPFSLKPSMEADALQVPHPVHRLDFPTSGLLVVAKTRKALSALGKQFGKKEIKKKYRAIVVGKPENEGEIKTPIAGQEAITRFSLVRTIPSLKAGSVSLLDLFPITGKTHQLRIHMSSQGFPIVGDSKYTENIPLLKGKGLFLAAVQLSFVHPSTGESLSLAIDQPPKFDTLLKREELRWKKYRQ